MRRYLVLVGILMVTLLLLFAIVEALGVPLLTDPSGQLNRGGWVAVVIGVGLLIVDVLLPVPSSVIMVANGATFGVAIGTLLSLIGSTGAALTGFWMGRRGGRLLDRMVSPDERRRANDLLDRWGTLAIIVSRPLPVLAETMAIVAGTSRLSFRQVFVSVVIGALPASLIYAITGALASSFASGAVVFVAVVVLAGLFWLAATWVEKRINTSPRH